MIFSKRKTNQDTGASPIQISEIVFATSQMHQAAEMPDAWRRRTDTDGTERRARQTKQDNELL